MSNLSIGIMITAEPFAVTFLIRPLDWQIAFGKMTEPVECAYCMFGPLFFSVTGRYEGPIK